MSLLFDGDTARADLGVGAPGFSALTVAMWTKQPSELERKGFLNLSYDTTEAENPKMFFRNVDGFFIVNPINASGVDQSITHDVDGMETGWHLLIYRHDDATDTQKTRRDGGSDDSTGAFTQAFPGSGNMRYVTMGRWSPADDTNYISNVHRAAHIAIYDRYLSDAECDYLFDGGAGGQGGNPMSVSGADPIAYWPGDSLTDLIGGYTLTSLEGTVTVDSGDNPAVDDPPEGGGGGITLTQVERGRVLARGLCRGLA